MAYDLYCGRAMRNNKFVTIVIWAIVFLVVAGLALPVVTSFFGF